MAIEQRDVPDGFATEDADLNEMLYARHAEVESFKDLETQRGTQIPALFNQFYKFIQNPSSVSIETFKRMIDTDDTIGSGVDFLTTCLAARLGKYEHPSQEITEWVNQRLNDIQGGWFNMVKELLSATWAGFAVQEKVWANTENGFVVDRCLTYPPSTILFETERTGELTRDGILQYQRNYNPGLGGGSNYYGGVGSASYGFSGAAFQPDVFAKFGDIPFPLRTSNSFNYLSVRIPKLKCIHYAFDAQGKFGNPYGRSLLRRCYKYYVMKDAFLQMLSIALDRKGTPLTIVYCDPSATLRDPNSAPNGRNAKGQNAGIRADVAAQAAFKNVHNDTTLFLPGKKGQTYDTDFVPQDAHADQFLAALRYCDECITRALLIPGLIFGNGNGGGGSYSLGQEHARTFDNILDGMLEGLKQTLLHQLIFEMLAYNFPESAWKKDGLGDFNKRDMSQEETQKIMDMYEKAVNIGVIDPTDLADLNKMRDTMKFDPRDKPIDRENIPIESHPDSPGKSQGESDDGE